MEHENKHDKVFLEILEDEGHLLSFLDTVFGFMYRCTDLYKIKSKTDSRLGFNPGVSESAILKIFHKWNARAKEDKMSMNPVSSDDSVRPPRETPPSPTLSELDTQQKRFQSAGESYNGAVRDGFRWSQSIGDVDVSVNVPKYVVKGNQLRVTITALSINVTVMSEDAKHWNTLLCGELTWKTVKEESIWSLVPGKHIQIHLEKCHDRWWEALFTDEPKIDVLKIDKSRPIDELSEEEQMKVAELMWIDDRKKRGLTVSPEAGTMEEVMKESWNREGSPFKGTPYDPRRVRTPPDPPKDK